MSEKFDGYEEELAKREEVIKNMKEDVTKFSKCSRETLYRYAKVTRYEKIPNFENVWKDAPDDIKLFYG